MIRGRYVPALDGLRAVAILLVIPHNADIFGRHPGAFLPLAIAAHVGWVGVQLFFVLSGFLITGNLLDSRGDRHYFRNFWIRRVLRIFPLYYATLAVALLVVIASGRPAAPGEVWLWLFLNNWTQPFSGSPNGFAHFWSLAVEEQFYLLWPLVVARLGARSLAYFCMFTVLVALASRVVLKSLAAPDATLYMFTICRMDALAIGAMAAIVQRHAQARAWLQRHMTAILCAGCALLLFGALFSKVYDTNDLLTQLLGYPLLAAVFAAAILLVSAEGPGLELLKRMLSPDWLRSIGRYSFAMYVFHLPLTIALAPALQSLFAPAGIGAAPLFALAITAVSYLAGMLSFELFEKRFLSLRHRWAPVGGNAKRVDGF